VVVVLIFFVLQQQLENHVLVPRIMSRQVGVSAVTVIVALLIGGSLAGIVGASSPSRLPRSCRSLPRKCAATRSERRRPAILACHAPRSARLPGEELDFTA